MKLRLDVDGVVHAITLEPGKAGALRARVGDEVLDVTASVGPDGIDVVCGGEPLAVGRPDRDRVVVNGVEHRFRILALEGGPGHDGATAGAGTVRAPMPGRLEAIRVKVGQRVAAGDVLFVLEAMKMRNEVRAPGAGTIAAIHATVGASLAADAPVVDIGPSP